MNIFFEIIGKHIEEISDKEFSSMHESIHLKQHNMTRKRIG